MKAWQVIVATLVIFVAGLVTGSVLSQRAAKPALPVARPELPPPPVPWIAQERFLQTMKRELALAPGQVQRLEVVFAESRERMRILMDLINPELQAEKREVAEKIRVELTPEQREKFEQLLKRPHRAGEGDGKARRGPGGDRKATNASAALQL